VGGGRDVAVVIGENFSDELYHCQHTVVLFTMTEILICSFYTNMTRHNIHCRGEKISH